MTVAVKRHRKTTRHRGVVRYCSNSSRHRNREDEEGGIYESGESEIVWHEVVGKKPGVIQS